MWLEKNSLKGSRYQTFLKHREVGGLKTMYQKNSLNSLSVGFKYLAESELGSFCWDARMKKGYLEPTTFRQTMGFEQTKTGRTMW